MEQNVIIQIEGNNVTEDGERELVSLVTRGEYREEDGVHCLRYVENNEESGEDILTTIQVEGEKVFITDGNHHNPILFVRGTRFAGTFYDEEDAPVEFGVFPTAVTAEMHPESGRLHLNYQVDVDGCVQGSNSISLTYRSCDC